MRNCFSKKVGVSVLALLLCGSAVFAQPVVLSVSPAQNAVGVPRDATISAEFSQAVTGVDENSFVVYGHVSGYSTGTLQGHNTSSIDFTPNSPFKHGETVQVTLTTGIQAIGIGGSHLTKPIVWTFSVATQPSTADFSVASEIVGATGKTMAVALGDVDGDGDLDFFEGNLVGSPAPFVNGMFRNNGSSSPWSGVNGVPIAEDGGDPRSFAIADINRDGNMDLIIGSNHSTGRLYLNNGTTSPWLGVERIGFQDEVDSRGKCVAVGDVNGDGYLDLLFACHGQPNLLYLNNTTANPYGTPFVLDPPGDLNRTQSIALGDVDNDGDLDVVTGAYNDPYHENRLYLNNGSADPFAGVESIAIASDSVNTYSVAFGDVDGDGCPASGENGICRSVSCSQTRRKVSCEKDVPTPSPRIGSPS